MKQPVQPPVRNASVSGANEAFGGTANAAPACPSTTAAAIAMAVLRSELSRMSGSSSVGFVGCGADRSVAIAAEANEIRRGPHRAAAPCRAREPDAPRRGVICVPRMKSSPSKRRAVWTARRAAVRHRSRRRDDPRGGERQLFPTAFEPSPDCRCTKRRDAVLMTRLLGVFSRIVVPLTAPRPTSSAQTRRLRCSPAGAEPARRRCC